MKKLMLGLMMAFVATAEAGIVKEYKLNDSLTATLDDQGVLRIIGSGPMPNWGRVEDQVWYDEFIKIKSVVGEGVTSVGKYAFRDCASLTSVSLPNATTVGDGAFASCTLLASVAFPKATTIGVQAFAFCTKLTSVSLPKATEIGVGAFQNCNSIETVALSWDLVTNPDRTGWKLRDQAKLLGPWTKEEVENAGCTIGSVTWMIGGKTFESKAYENVCASYGVTPKSVQAVQPPPAPPQGAVTSWDALTNAVATAASGATVAVGADIAEAVGELVVPAGKAVTIKLYGKTVTCALVTVNGALSVGDADDSVGRIVATGGAKLAKSGSVALLGGPMRGTFTVLTSGVTLLFK